MYVRIYESFVFNIGLSNKMGFTQKMVDRILEQESAIRVVFSSDRKVLHLIPTWQDIEVLKAINDALGPLAEFQM